jgi:hypothetical protein
MMVMAEKHVFKLPKDDKNRGFTKLSIKKKKAQLTESIYITVTPDNGIICRNILCFFFCCDTYTTESSIFIIIMYHLEFTPKSYELIPNETHLR